MPVIVNTLSIKRRGLFLILKWSFSFRVIKLSLYGVFWRKGEKSEGERTEGNRKTWGSGIEEERTSYSNSDLKGFRKDSSKFFTFFSCLCQRIF